MHRVSFAVQAHPSRLNLALALSEKLGAEIVLDPDPYSEIRSPWRTFRHLLEKTPYGATHRFQIQDDALPCPGLREAVELAVAARPDRLLVFFVGGNPSTFARAVLDSCARGDSWARLDHGQWCPVVATCWPVAWIEPLIEYVTVQRWPERFYADDEIVGRFLRDTRRVALATVPSLVEHEDMLPSLIGRRDRQGEDRGRIAACYIGDCADCTDARTIDWTLGPD